jgi:hypothetical protein
VRLGDAGTDVRSLFRFLTLDIPVYIENVGMKSIFQSLLFHRPNIDKR